MRFRRVPPGHWLGVLILLLAVCLSVAGVASPWWRVLDDRLCSSFEGLWQQCFRCWDRRMTCHFSGRDTGVWRAVQALQLLSLACVAGALLVSVACADRRRCTRGKCPAPSLVALIGGVAGLVSNLMFVGYTERHVRHAPLHHVYAWSFAMAVTGCLLSLLAALLLGVARALCSPRYTSQPAAPYWPYHHYSISVDSDGLPHYLPYPAPSPSPSPYPGIQMGIGAVSSSSSSASEKRKLFEQYRQGPVQQRTEEEKVPPDVPGFLPACIMSLDNGRGGAGEEKAAPGNVSSGADRPPEYHEIERRSIGDSRQTDENQAADSRTAQPEPQPTDQASGPSLNEDGSPSVPDQSQHNTESTSPAVVLTIDLPDQPDGSHLKERTTTVFTVEKAFRESCGTGDSRRELGGVPSRQK
ncbi:uncharacterized protein LOC143294506 [Babylonia areolata]|uniref:uncharacterized protein LOC143294506 n=1 Tax=Babylonia areolata TaxID=304850 RepID=UPI003FD4EEC4